MCVCVCVCGWVCGWVGVGGGEWRGRRHGYYNYTHIVNDKTPPLAITSLHLFFLIIIELFRPCETVEIYKVTFLVIPFKI